MPDRCETDTGAESGDHQSSSLPSQASCPIHTSRLISMVPPTSICTKLKHGKKKKIYAGKENSAIRVNYPGRKSVPRWPVTRGEIIKTKGMEGSADQREARDVAWIFPARPPVTLPVTGRLFKLRPQRAGTPWSTSTGLTPPQDLLTGENISLLRANNTDADERGEKEPLQLHLKLFRA